MNAFRIPFAVVSAVWKFQPRQNGQGTGTTEMSLVDTSPAALSELLVRN
jgi:hypothetical protein